MSDPVAIQLKEHIERILDERDKRTQSEKEAIAHRLENLNNLREQVMQDRASFMSKAVFEQMHKDVERRMAELENTLSRMTGVGMVLIVVSGIVGAAIGALIAHILK